MQIVINIVKFILTHDDDFTYICTDIEHVYSCVSIMEFHRKEDTLLYPIYMCSDECVNMYAQKETMNQSENRYFHPNLASVHMQKS